MQNRIAAMHQTWNELDSLKSPRQPAPKDNPAKALNKVPPPPFEKAVPPFKPAARERALPPSADLFPGWTVPVDATAKARYKDAASSTDSPKLPSTPPKLSVNRPMSPPSSCIDLPELPPEDAEDSEASSSSSSSSSPSSSSSSAASSPRASEPASSAIHSSARKLRKRASKRLSQIAIDLSGLAQKMSPRSGKSSPVSRASPSSRDPLAGVPPAERNRMAVEMAKYCQSDVYRAASEKRQAILFNGKLIGLLGEEHREMIRPDALKALSADLEWRMKHAVVDIKVDLKDPQFTKFVNAAAEASFLKPWTHDSADASDSATGAKKKNADVLRPTFVRDFGNSDYFFRNADGTLSRIQDTNHFIALVDNGKSSGMAPIVSNIASQNLGNFLKNVLFLRHDSEGISQSVLRLHDGTPIMPLAVVKASYTLGKDSQGNITLDYEWNSSNHLNSGKTLRAKRMAGDQSAYDVQEAALKIKVRITIGPDREWHIGDPRIEASGWSLPSGE